MTGKEKYLVPTKLGKALIDGYRQMGLDLSSPTLRAELDANLQCICSGKKDSKNVLAELIHLYKEKFLLAVQRVESLTKSVAKFINLVPKYHNVNFSEGFPSMSLEPIRACPICDGYIFTEKKKNKEWSLSCSNKNSCNHEVVFPANVEDVSVAINPDGSSAVCDKEHAMDKNHRYTKLRYISKPILKCIQM